MKNSDYQLAALSPVPLYSQIREVLRNHILNGTYAPLSRVPSESELGELFKVSRITIRQALNDLQKDGLIFRIPGKGTYVSKPKAFQNVSSLQGLAESLARFGHEVTNRVRSFHYAPAPPLVAERLHLSEGEQVAEIKRVRYVNREPVSLEVTYLPEEAAKGLEKADLITRDIFLILENDLGYSLGHADLSIDAVQANEELATVLNIAIGAPIMRIERLTHLEDGTPLDFEYLYYRGDAFQYRLRIDRQRAERGRQDS